MFAWLPWVPLPAGRGREESLTKMESSTRALPLPQPLGIPSFWYPPLSPGQLHQSPQRTDVTDRHAIQRPDFLWNSLTWDRVKKPALRYPGCPLISVSLSAHLCQMGMCLRGPCSVRAQHQQESTGVPQCLTQLTPKPALGCFLPAGRGQVIATSSPCPGGSPDQRPQCLQASLGRRWVT